MTRESGTVQGYLGRCLADGARPFLFRSRVRALLGLPLSGGVEMQFPKPLPIPGFGYVVRRLTGEFDLPDEMVSQGSRDVSYASGLTARSNAPDRNQTALERVQAQSGKQPHPANKQAPTEAAVLKQPAALKPPVRTAPPAVSSGDVKTVEHSVPQVRAKRTDDPSPSSEESAGPAVQPHAEFVPGAWREKSAAGGLPGSEQAERKSGTSIPVPYPWPDLGARVERPDQAASVAGTRQLRGKPETHADEIKRAAVVASSQVIEDRTSDVSLRGVSPKTIEPQVRRTVGAMAAISEPLVATSRPSIGHDEAVQTVWVTRSFPRIRQADPESGRGSRESAENDHTSWPDTSPGAAPAADPAPPPPPQIAFVKQSSESGTPVAFWERRYLSHLRVRVRR
jgi:hypothetical protein